MGMIWNWLKTMLSGGRWSVNAIPNIEPHCPYCMMILSNQNLEMQSRLILPDELKCKHGVTNPPQFTPDGFLASGPFFTPPASSSQDGKLAHMPALQDVTPETLGKALGSIVVLLQEQFAG